MIEFFKENWVATIYTTIIAGITFAVKKLFKRVKTEVAEQANLKAGMRAMLRDRLHQGCQFYIKQNSISVSDMENIEGLYNSYHDLGGNGTTKELYERVKHLQIKDNA